MAKNDKKHLKTTPYIPLKTFSGFIEKLKQTAVPSKIDHSLLDTMSGSMKGQLLSSLRFLNLLNSENTVLEPLKKLVNSYNTEAWGETLSSIIFDAYMEVIGDLDLDTGTARQLYDAFRLRGNVDGQMLDKAVRFFLGTLVDCGITFSPHFKGKITRKTGPRKPKKGKKKSQKYNDNDLDDDLDEEEETLETKRAKIEIDIPGKKSVSVRLPVDMDEEDWEMVKTMLEAYVKRLTKVGGNS